MGRATRYAGGIAVILVVGALSSQALSAESARSSEGRGPVAMKRGKGALYGPDQRLKLMTVNLGLTTEQQAQIRPILAEEYAEMEALRGNDSYNRDERRARLLKLNQASYEKIKPLLTAEQQKKHDIAKQKIMENRSKSRSTRPGPNPGENDPERRLQRLTEHLGLTTEQQSRVKPILAEEFAELEKLRGNDSLNRNDRRARLLQLNQLTSEKLQPILTVEQQKLYNETINKIGIRRAQSKDAPLRQPLQRQAPGE